MKRFINIYPLANIAILAAVVPLVWLCFLKRSGIDFGYPLDDSYIYFTFAKNMAFGQWFVYSSGFGPTSGATGPLWAVLLTPLFVFFKNPLVAVAILGVGTHCTVAVLSYYTALKLGSSRQVSLFIGLCIAVSTHLTWLSLSGMEAEVTAVFFLTGLYFLVAETKTKQIIGLSAFALAGWLRPEMFLISFMALIWLLYRLRLLKTLSWTFIIPVLIFIFVMAAWALLNMYLAKAIVPSTFTAKVGVKAGYNIFSDIFMPLVYTVYLVLYDQPLVIILLAASFWLCIRGYKINNSKGQVNNVIVIVGLFVFLILRNFITNGMSPGTNGRYIPFVFAAIPVMAFGVLDSPVIKCGISMWRKFLLWSIMVLIVLCLCVIYIKYQANWMRPLIEGMGFHGNSAAIQFRSWVLKIAVGFGTLMAISGLWSIYAAQAKRLYSLYKLIFVLIALSTGLHYRAIKHYCDDVGAINNIQVTMAKWVACNIPQNEIIAAGDVGAVAYFGQHRLIDVVGLVSPDIMRYRASQFNLGVGPEKATLTYLSDRHILYYALYESDMIKLSNATGVKFDTLAIFPRGSFQGPHPGKQGVYRLALGTDEH